jgi:pimeloyl-ACP methyl ester carboxylesterase
MSTITTKDGAQIFYSDWGSAQPIVFSHGWPLTADEWFPLRERAAGRRQRGSAGRVIATVLEAGQDLAKLIAGSIGCSPGSDSWRPPGPADTIPPARSSEPPCGASNLTR